MMFELRRGPPRRPPSGGGEPPAEEAAAAGAEEVPDTAGEAKPQGEPGEVYRGKWALYARWEFAECSQKGENSEAYSTHVVVQFVECLKTPTKLLFREGKEEFFNFECLFVSVFLPLPFPRREAEEGRGDENCTQQKKSLPESGRKGA